jgi:molecular chaperone DnaK
MFTTAVDNQRSMLIHVLQGERERAKDNWSLGRFTIDFGAAPKGMARVGVQFEIDADGILHVLARDVKTGKQTVVPMKSAVDVDDAAVQKMVEESVEFAFEDLKARQWIEIKMRGVETVKATRKALQECGGEIEPAYKEQIEAALSEVESLLATESAGEHAGDTSRLRASIASLDQVTKPLAEMLMDRAMETVLRKRGLIS